MPKQNLELERIRMYAQYMDGLAQENKIKSKKHYFNEFLFFFI